MHDGYVADDLNTLSAAEEAQQKNFIYQVVFEVLASEDGGAVEWAQDEITVAAGPDGQKAIDQVRDYALDEEQYGLEAKGFRVLGLKILAMAEI